VPASQQGNTCKVLNARQVGEQPADAPQLKALLAPYPSDDMICWPVRARVGNVRNNDPSLIEPIAAVS
jgi:putative SOS response-associated peptidase YedK